MCEGGYVGILEAFFFLPVAGATTARNETISTVRSIDAVWLWGCDELQVPLVQFNRENQRKTVQTVGSFVLGFGRLGVCVRVVFNTTHVCR